MPQTQHAVVPAASFIPGSSTDAILTLIDQRIQQLQQASALLKPQWRPTLTLPATATVTLSRGGTYPVGGIPVSFPSSSAHSPAPTLRRILSASARARISAAQKTRWRKHRKAQKATSAGRVKKAAK